MAKHIAVLLGGHSAEREVSLDSGRACAEALRTKGYEVTEVDAGVPLCKLVELLSKQVKPDVIFNALHGRFGEDGCIQGVLNLLNIPYTHSGLLASSLAMDKAAAKRVFAAHGIKCAEDKILMQDDLNQGDPLPRPFVLKPVDEGSSVGVRIVLEGDNQPLSGEGAPDLGIKPSGRVMAEAYIEGREFTVAVMDGKALSVTEIRPKTGFYDYRAKYTDGITEHLIPAPIDQELWDTLTNQALTAHEALGCRGVSRADFRVSFDDDGNHDVYILEVNTQPGMTALSLVPEQAAHVGVSFPDLTAWMVENARCDG
jgi:D-alanine-D-alanine ligase